MFAFYLTTAIVVLSVAPLQARNVVHGKRETRIYPLYLQIQCEGDSLHLACEHSSQKLQIEESNYGRQSRNDCRLPILIKPLSELGESESEEVVLSDDVCISEASSQAINDECNGKNSCEVEVSDENLGSDCAHVNRYIYVSYRCM
jgi:hypothetical protein